jgi:hypothetical protein
MPGLDSQLNGYLLLATLAGMLAGFLMLGVCFAIWIRSLETELSVHAPLVDGPRRR